MIVLSIVLATYNQAAKLSRCLESLAKQTLPADRFEVIVVVDGSTDETISILKRFPGPYALRVIWQENSGQAAALNRGVQEAVAPHCLFLDDDIRLDPSALAEHVAAQTRSGGVFAMGRLKLDIGNRPNAFAACVSTWWTEHFQRLEREGISSFVDCYGANVSLPRAAFLSAGGFDTTLVRGYDSELAYRLHAQGVGYVYLQAATGHQEYDKTALDLARLAVQEGSGGVQLYSRHRQMLPFLQLGMFWERSLPEVLLRLALLMIRMPAEPLVAIGAFLRRGQVSVRWHRFLHTYCYWRGVQKACAGKQEWKRFTIGVPILLYHAFDRETGAAGPYTVPEKAFRRQMKWLASHSYQVLHIDEYLAYVRECIPPPARSVVITIDDGYRDNWTIAYPILRKHGLPATVFVATGYVGRTNEWVPNGELARRPMLTWADIQQMAAGNVSFGAHTVTHPVLSSLNEDAIRREMQRSREMLSEVLGRCPSTFAYPYGEFNAAAERIAEQTGFLGACSVHRGLNGIGTKRQFALRRTTVHGTDSFPRFLLGLWTGYTQFFVFGKAL